MLEVILATNRSVFHNIKNKIEVENFQKNNYIKPCQNFIGSY